jgi:hypothetical protein
MKAGCIEIKFTHKQDKAKGSPFYLGFKPSSQVLKKDTAFSEAPLASLPCEILKERDVPLRAS